MRLSKFPADYAALNLVFMDDRLLDVLLDAWNRNNAILVNLLRALPNHGFEARAMEGSPSVAELFAHMDYVRRVFILEDAPEFALEMLAKEWATQLDPRRLEQMLNESCAAVREAVAAKVKTGMEMQAHYDHPILFLQHLIWHEGYHHGQIKLALKLAGCAIADQEAGPLTWGIWMRKAKKPAFDNVSD